VGFFDEFLKTAQDYDMWMRILKYYDLKIIKIPLLKLRWHGLNLTYRTTSETEFERAKVLLKAYKSLTIEDIFTSLYQKKEKMAYGQAYEKLASYMEKSGIPALFPISQICRDRKKVIIDGDLEIQEFLREVEEEKFELRFWQKEEGKIHILIEVSTLDKGGLEEVIYNIATHLSPTHFQVVVVCVERGGYMEHRLRETGIPVEILSQEKEKDYLEILQRYKIDLVNTHFSHFGPPIAYREGIPVISFIHSFYIWVSNKLLDEFRRVDPYITKYIAVSNDIAKYAQYRFNIPSEKIQVIPNGIDEKRYQVPIKKPSLTRMEIGLKEEDFVFLHVGAISRTKMHNLLIAALKRISVNFPSIKIICVGHTLQEDYYQFIQRRVNEEGVGDKIKFIGFKEDVIPYYQLADAFVLTSLIEGFSISMLEAMYFGLPMILTRTGEKTESIIENEDIGILINNCYQSIIDLDEKSLEYYPFLSSPNNTDDLVRAMEDFYTRKEFWKEAGKKGRDKIFSLFSLEKIIPQYEKEFIKLTILQKNKRIQNQSKLINEKRNQIELFVQQQQKNLIEISSNLKQIQIVQNNAKERLENLENQINYILRRLSIKERAKDRIEKIRLLFRRITSRLLNKRKTFNIIDGTEEEKINSRNRKKHPAKELPSGVLKGNRFDIFFFPMIDFSFRYQRPQQLATFFAKEGHRVFYLNITQFLPPDAKDNFRIKEIKENVFEVFLKCQGLLDIYRGNNNSATINSLHFSLNSLRKQWQLITVVGVVHNPYWTDLALRMKEEHHWKIIYDCMDEWENFQGLGNEIIEVEDRLVKKVDLITVTAELLYKKWKTVNKNCLIIRNACDFEHFSKASPNTLLANIPRPIIGFFGGIAEWIDIELIRRVAIQQKNWSFVLLGGIFTDVTPIKGLPNVYLLGNQPYSTMPDYLINFDICIIPFKKNKITESANPVKLYEYFSLGKPVVARDLTEIKYYQDYIYVYHTEEEFVSSVQKALNEKDEELKEKRKKIAATNTWNDRIHHININVKELFGKASIIIVTYNNLYYTKLCIESLFSKTEYPNIEIIVVDNNSSDGTPYYLKEMEKLHSEVKVILNKQNLGFAKANNQGLSSSNGQYIVFLNNDTVVTKGWLSKFINYLNNFPEIGLIGPITNSCGNEAQIDTWYENMDEMDVFAYEYTKDHEGSLFDINMLALYCAAMRKEVFDKIGPLDESFKIGMFEDDDYSYRIKKAGYRIVCAEDVFIHHFGRTAFNKLIQTGEYQTIFEENKRLFEKKWGIKWVPHTHRKKE
jgi:glycosyltransferase involved in cell wall biosynthesis/GT2 family glycosyltransferase